jgi:hypothetical protein
MRVATITTGTLLAALIAAPSFAQAPPCPASAQTLVFDPYDPSDLAIVRNYGGTVMSQAPLGSLLALDPYVPTQAALLRQVGGAIPWWPLVGCVQCPLPAVPPPSPCVTQTPPALSPPPEIRHESPGPFTAFSDVVSVLQARGALEAAAARPASVVAPARVQGISIEYGGRRWTSAGPAIPFVERAFERIGQSGGSPVFRRAGERDGLIYIPTTPGMVAPFRRAR